MTVFSRLAGYLAKLPPARTRDVSVERDLEAKMPDGVVLLADRWYPSGGGSSCPPVILLRTPYGRRQAGMLGRLFAERGYQVVIQSCRGTFGSGGDWTPFVHEPADGRASLEWIANQGWFDGRLATFGPSYLGLTQWAVADDPPEQLRAMALQVTARNVREAVIYPMGGFSLATSLSWIHQLEHQEQGWGQVLRAQLTSGRRVKAASRVLPLANSDSAMVGRHVGFFQDWLAHDAPADPWWEPARFARGLDRVPPASLVGGWYDLFLPSQVADFQALRAANRPARLTIGPWTHMSPGAFAASLRDGLEWFDRQLGRPTPKADESGVRVFVMGDRRWVAFGEWPPPADPQRWHLQASGQLGPAPPAASSPDRYRFDPADPTPSAGGPSLDWTDAGGKDQRRRESRPDVLTYTSSPLTADLTVIGPLQAELHVRSTLDHTDFFVRLCDVSPRGRSTNLSDGMVRLSPSDITKAADGSFRAQIPMWPTANTFKRGHRVRLQVSSAAHPLFDRNTGSGEPLATATKLRVADQEVLHDAEHPSFVLLPVAGI